MHDLASEAFCVLGVPSAASHKKSIIGTMEKGELIIIIILHLCSTGKESRYNFAASLERLHASQAYRYS